MPSLFANFLSMLVTVIWLLVLARVIVSWTMPQGGGQLIAFLYQVTEPLLAPIRRLLPPAGGVDWSPLIAMLILTTLVRLLRF